MLLGDTWLWDGSTWTSPTSSGPSARVYPTMATLNGKVVLFGGMTAAGAQGDTWIWDGATWSNPTITGGPGKRCGAMMATR
jgi:hypothetical protein